MIRLAARQMHLQQIADCFNILPIIDLFVQAQIRHEYGRRPRDARITIDKDFLILIVDHVVEVLAGLEDAHVVLVLVAIIDLKVFCK